MLAALSIVALLCAPAHGLYVKIVEGSEKCYLESVPEDTALAIKYEVKNFKAWGQPGFTGVVSAHSLIAEPVSICFLLILCSHVHRELLFVFWILINEL
jgi:hypothetical protein